MIRVHESPATDMARLFLALLPPVTARAALTAHIEAWHWPADAAVYAGDDWHVTLHYIGPVPRARVDELQAGLSLPLTPFELRFGVPALWPHGLAVLLPMAVPPALQELHGALGQRLHQLGLRTDERPYRPHLTLARHAGQALPPAPPAWGWPVQAYVLMASTGRPASRYRVLQHYGDSGAAAARQA
jgi:2'-5' RNA ligase